MAVTFEVTVPDVWAQRMLPAVGERALDIEGHVIVQKVLQAWGEAAVDDLTGKQKAELVCLFDLWHLTAKYESSVASDSARQAALQSAIDDFNG
jgi:hypothetical protein